ncbi:unnamed protein product [Caenorhabditis angaria]|uniref:T20D4.11-like domain-containing protein n=1 Tax=Caenorhabditis angaria TaxID=860376 RepID=A0A9P1IV76_9PELO|nr:unnamed protein product [Caenorhabditis angaria]
MKLQLIFSIFLFQYANSIDSKCSADDILKVGQCLEKMTDAVEKINSWVDKNFTYTDSEKDEFNKKCEDTKTCFEEIQKNCDDFPGSVIDGMTVMCDRFEFMTSDFSTCVPKLNSLTEKECVKQFFGEEYAEMTIKDRCEALNENSKCVTEEVAKDCGDEMAGLLGNHLKTELKKYKCSKD